MTTTAFLLTDVARSTALWEEAPDATAAALARHDAIVEGEVAAAGGRVVPGRGEGDSRFAVFDCPAAAAVAAASITRAMSAEPWPTPRPLALRMALDVGAGDVYGPQVNRAVRLRSAAWPGQIVVSEVAARGLGNGSVVDLGWHRLGELGAPERVFQLTAPGLLPSFPPLASARRGHNLPEANTSFVGRELEVAEVAKLLEAHRLVTILGVGGAGKTRLALEVAARSVTEHRDGAWVVELAPLTDPALVASAVAAALSVRDTGRRDALAAVIEHLRERKLVLVLDNCEHLIDAAAAAVRRLLAAAAGLRVLATSRQPLGVTSELSWPIPPLETPDPARLHADNLADYEATELFWQRAAAARPGLVLDADGAAAAARICARLDGLPLAIELAAARAADIPLPQLDRHLDDHLAEPAAAGPSRQRTLRAAIDWSYHLLEAPEQVLFRRLAVFAGSFAIEAVEAVCPADDLDPDDTLDLLAALVAKSLVNAEARGPLTRYRLLETIRAYAAERLEEAREAAAVAARHLEFFMGVATHTVRIDGDDHDNYRRALAWSLEHGRAESALRVAVALHGYWSRTDQFREAQAWLERALASTALTPTGDRVLALLALGQAREKDGHPRQAQAPTQEALALARRLGDKVLLAEALSNLASRRYTLGDYDQAKTLNEQALVAWRESGAVAGHTASLNSVLHNLGHMGWEQFRFDDARSWYGQAIEVAHARDDSETSVWHHLAMLGMVEDSDGRYDVAEELYHEAARGLAAAGNTNWLTIIDRNLGLVAFHRGNLREAAARYREGLERVAEIPVPVRIGEFLQLLGWVAAAMRDRERAARFIGAADGRRLRSGMKIPPPIGAERDQIEARLRTAMGEAEFDRRWADGGRAPLGEVVDEALAFADQMASAR